MQLVFADNIDMLGGSEDELQQFTESMGKNSCWMRIRSLFRQRQSPCQQHQAKAIHQQHVDEWENAGRSGPVQILRITKGKEETSIKEVKIRLLQAHSTMTKLAILRKNKPINFPRTIKLNKLLVLSILLCGCVSWTLTADLERRSPVFENKCYRRMLGISYVQRAQNERICMATGQCPPRTSGTFIVNRQSSWFIMVRRCLPS